MKKYCILYLALSFMMAGCSNNQASDDRPNTDNVTVQSNNRVNATNEVIEQNIDISNAEVENNLIVNGIEASKETLEQSITNTTDTPTVSATDHSLVDERYCKNLDTTLVANFEDLDSILSTKTENNLYDVASLYCELPKANEAGLIVLTSEDRLLRSFAWNTNYGGTWVDFSGYFQFVDSKGNVHIQNMDELGIEEMTNTLFTTSINEKPVYMLSLTGVYSSANRTEKLMTLQIDNGTLAQPKIIKTASGLTNTLKFDYDFFSVVDSDHNYDLFQFNQTEKVISFPVVIKDDKYKRGKVTNNSIEYKFDGQYFQRYKN